MQAGLRTLVEAKRSLVSTLRSQQLATAVRSVQHAASQLAQTSSLCVPPLAAHGLTLLEDAAFALCRSLPNIGERFSVEGHAIIISPAQVLQCPPLKNPMPAARCRAAFQRCSLTTTALGHRSQRQVAHHTATTMSKASSKQHLATRSSLAQLFSGAGRRGGGAALSGGARGGRRTARHRSDCRCARRHTACVCGRAAPQPSGSLPAAQCRQVHCERHRDCVGAAPARQPGLCVGAGLGHRHRHDVRCC